MRTAYASILIATVVIGFQHASSATLGDPPPPIDQQVPDIRDPSVHGELLEGEWEPSAAVQEHLDVPVPYNFYRFKNDAALAKRFKSVIEDAKKAGCKPIGYGWTTETDVLFMKGREIRRSVKDYPYALFGCDRGLVLQLTNIGTEEEPRWREQCLAVFRGEKPENDLLLIRHGLRSPAAAFQRATVRQPREKAKRKKGD